MSQGWRLDFSKSYAKPWLHLAFLHSIAYFFMECSQVRDGKKKEKTESILQMPQTFFLLTQPKAETLLIIQF